MKRGVNQQPISTKLTILIDTNLWHRLFVKSQRATNHLKIRIIESLCPTSTHTGIRVATQNWRWKVVSNSEFSPQVVTKPKGGWSKFKRAGRGAQSRHAIMEAVRSTWILCKRSMNKTTWEISTERNCNWLKYPNGNLILLADHMLLLLYL